MNETLLWPSGIIWPEEAGLIPIEVETIYFEFDEETGEPFITEVRREYI